MRAQTTGDARRREETNVVPLHWTRKTRRKLTEENSPGVHTVVLLHTFLRLSK